MHRPSYRDLLARVDAPPGSTWGMFADLEQPSAQAPSQAPSSSRARSQRGMAGLAGPGQVRDAAALVTTGLTCSLDYALDAFDPPTSPRRTLPRHEITALHRDQRDDRLDSFYLQGTTQIDGLRHRRHHRYGFYDGVPDEAIRPGAADLGVNRWADAPIVGRGVLLDVDHHRRLLGRPIDHAGGEALPIELLDEVADAQGVDLRVGDLLLVHTGWASWFVDELTLPQRGDVLAAGRFTGFAQSEAMIGWHWDRGVALAASDTVGLEVIPPVPTSHFGGDTDGGLVHQDLIALLGLPIGELWKLDTLAAVARQEGRWEFFTVVKPLALTGGVGSPANATVVL